MPTMREASTPSRSAISKEESKLRDPDYEIGAPAEFIKTTQIQLQSQLQLICNYDFSLTSLFPLVKETRHLNFLFRRMVLVLDRSMVDALCVCPTQFAN